MPLWARDQQCPITTDHTNFILIVDQFERVMPVEAEPLSWMRARGHHVMSQPLHSIQPLIRTHSPPPVLSGQLLRCWLAYDARRGGIAIETGQPASNVHQEKMGRP